MESLARSTSYLVKSISAGVESKSDTSRRVHILLMTSAAAATICEHAIIEAPPAPAVSSHAPNCLHSEKTFFLPIENWEKMLHTICVRSPFLSLSRAQLIERSLSRSVAKQIFHGAAKSCLFSHRAADHNIECSLLRVIDFPKRRARRATLNFALEWVCVKISESSDTRSICWCAWMNLNFT